jgi:hypothetical protein
MHQSVHFGIKKYAEAHTPVCYLRFFPGEISGTPINKGGESFEGREWKEKKWNGRRGSN